MTKSQLSIKEQIWKLELELEKMHLNKAKGSGQHDQMHDECIQEMKDMINLMKQEFKKACLL